MSQVETGMQLLKEVERLRAINADMLAVLQAVSDSKALKFYGDTQKRVAAAIARATGEKS